MRASRVSLARHHVEVVVVAGDGEVPHPAVMHLGRGASVGKGRGAISSLEVGQNDGR